MVLLIDNYDSFVYNLAQYLGELGYEPMVYRNNRLTLAQIQELAPSHILLSPGPGTPLDAGICNDVVREIGGKIPILGICLGHQCIGYVHGARIGRSRPIHARTSLIHHDGKAIYAGLPKPFRASRYHSLIIEADSVPSCLIVSAWTEDGLIMGVRHRDYVLEGVQFHPESIITEFGHDILRNFLRFSGPIWSDQN
jgi:para-aminobenzoate synthetase component II